LAVTPATSVSQYWAIMSSGQLEPMALRETTKISLKTSAMRLRKPSGAVMSWFQIMSSELTVLAALLRIQSRPPCSAGRSTCSPSQGR
jgi:hypothetical protein